MSNCSSKETCENIEKIIRNNILKYIKDEKNGMGKCCRVNDDGTIKIINKNEFGKKAKQMLLYGGVASTYVPLTDNGNEYDYKTVNDFFHINNNDIATIRLSQGIKDEITGISENKTVESSDNNEFSTEQERLDLFGNILGQMSYKKDVTETDTIETERVVVDAPAESYASVLIKKYQELLDRMKDDARRYLNLNHDVYVNANNEYSSERARHVRKIVNRYNKNINKLETLINSLRNNKNDNKNKNLFNRNFTIDVFNELYEILSIMGFAYEVTYTKNGQDVKLIHLNQSRFNTDTVNIDMIYERLKILERVVKEAQINNEQFDYVVKGYDSSDHINPVDITIHLDFPKIQSDLDLIMREDIYMLHSFIKSWLMNDDPNIKVYKMYTENDVRKEFEGKSEEEIGAEISRMVNEHINDILSYIDDIDDINWLNKIFTGGDTDVLTKMLVEITNLLRKRELGYIMHDKNEIEKILSKYDNKKEKREFQMQFFDYTVTPSGKKIYRPFLRDIYSDKYRTIMKQIGNTIRNRTRKSGKDIAKTVDKISEEIRKQGFEFFDITSSEVMNVILENYIASYSNDGELKQTDMFINGLTGYDQDICNACFNGNYRLYKRFIGEQAKSIITFIETTYNSEITSAGDNADKKVRDILENRIFPVIERTYKDIELNSMCNVNVLNNVMLTLEFNDQNRKNEMFNDDMYEKFKDNDGDFIIMWELLSNALLDINATYIDLKRKGRNYIPMILEKKARNVSAKGGRINDVMSIDGNTIPVTSGFRVFVARIIRDNYTNFEREYEGVVRHRSNKKIRLESESAYDDIHKMLSELDNGQLEKLAANLGIEKPKGDIDINNQSRLVEAVSITREYYISRICENVIMNYSDTDNMIDNIIHFMDTAAETRAENEAIVYAQMMLEFIRRKIDAVKEGNRDKIKTTLFNNNNPLGLNTSKNIGEKSYLEDLQWKLEAWIKQNIEHDKYDVQSHYSLFRWLRKRVGNTRIRNLIELDIMKMRDGMKKTDLNKSANPTIDNSLQSFDLEENGVNYRYYTYYDALRAEWVYRRTLEDDTIETISERSNDATSRMLLDKFMKNVVSVLETYSNLSVLYDNGKFSLNDGEETMSADVGHSNIDDIAKIFEVIANDGSFRNDTYEIDDINRRKLISFELGEIQFNFDFTYHMNAGNVIVTSSSYQINMLPLKVLTKDEYDNALKTYRSKSNDDLGRILTIESIMNGLTGDIAKTSLTVNFQSGVKNRLEGYLKSITCATSGRFGYDTEDFNKAVNFIRRINWMHLIRSENEIMDNEDSMKMMFQLKIFENFMFKMKNFQSHIGDAASIESSGYGILHILGQLATNVPENKNQGEVAMSVLYNMAKRGIIRIMNNKTGEYESIFDDKGHFKIYRNTNLELKKDYDTPENRRMFQYFNDRDMIGIISSKMDTAIKATQGNYSKVDSPLYRALPIVNTMMLFKTYLPMHMWQEYGLTKIDFQTGEKNIPGRKRLMMQDPKLLTEYFAMSAATTMPFVPLDIAWAISPLFRWDMLLTAGAGMFTGYKLISKAFRKRAKNTVDATMKHVKGVIEETDASLLDCISFFLESLGYTLALPVDIFKRNAIGRPMSQAIRLLTLGKLDLRQKSAVSLVKGLTNKQGKRNGLSRMRRDILSENAMEIARLVLIRGIGFGMLKALQGVAYLLDYDDDDDKEIPKWKMEVMQISEWIANTYLNACNMLYSDILKFIIPSVMRGELEVAHMMVLQNVVKAVEVGNKAEGYDLADRRWKYMSRALVPLGIPVRLSDMLREASLGLIYGDDDEPAVTPTGKMASVWNAIGVFLGQEYSTNYFNEWKTNVWNIDDNVEKYIDKYNIKKYKKVKDKVDAYLSDLKNDDDFTKLYEGYVNDFFTKIINKNYKEIFVPDDSKNDIDKYFNEHVADDMFDMMTGSNAKKDVLKNIRDSFKYDDYKEFVMRLNTRLGNNELMKDYIYANLYEYFDKFYEERYGTEEDFIVKRGNILEEAKKRANKEKEKVFNENIDNWTESNFKIKLDKKNYQEKIINERNKYFEKDGDFVKGSVETGEIAERYIYWNNVAKKAFNNEYADGDKEKNMKTFEMASRILEDYNRILSNDYTLEKFLKKKYPDYDVKSIERETLRFNVPVVKINFTKK